jgi:hypothetical protein
MTYGLEGRCSIQLSYWRRPPERPPRTAFDNAVRQAGRKLSKATNVVKALGR